MSLCWWSLFFKCEIHSTKKEGYAKRTENEVAHRHTAALNGTIFHFPCWLSNFYCIALLSMKLQYQISTVASLLQWGYLQEHLFTV